MSSRKIVVKPQWPVPTSGEKIRQKWLAVYRTIEKKLVKLKREWNLFESQAQSEYQSWYYQVFAPELNVLKNLEEQCRELSLILSAVDAQIRINRLTKRNAYAYVMETLAQKRDPFPTEAEQERDREEKRREFQEHFQEALGDRLTEELDPELLEEARAVVSNWAKRTFESPPRTASEAHHRGRAITEALHEVYEELRSERDSSNDYDSYSRGQNDDEPANEPKRDDVKTLYRKIVRALHPDRGQDMNPTEKELWGQAMAAYEAQDAAALKLILLRVEGSDGTRVEELQSIGEIMDLVKALEDELEEVNLHKSHVKKDPVYRFWSSRSKPKNRKILEADLDKNIRQRIFHLRGALRELNDEIAPFQKRR